MDDVEAIRQLTAEYNRAFDERDADRWVALFTKDGFFERSNAGRAYSGWEELRELIETFPVRGWHVTTDFIIAVDGDSAHSSCYLMYLDRDANFAVSIFGVYEDDVVRQDGQWRFRSRRLKVDVKK